MGNLMETLVDDGRFNTFVSAIQAANLTETLVGKAETGPFTLFAPSDDAFAGLPEGKVEALMADVPELTSLVTYHIVPGSLSSAQVVTRDTLTTVQGQDIKLQRMDGRVYANDAEIVSTDIQADNGVIHAIDSVLLPPKK